MQKLSSVRENSSAAKNFQRSTAAAAVATMHTTITTQKDNNNMDNNNNTTVESTDDVDVMSKNQRKKMMRLERRKEIYKMKKEMKRAKRRNPLAHKPENMSDEEWHAHVELKKRTAAVKKMQKNLVRERLKRVYEEGSTKAVSVVIDCSFDDLMTEAEIVSLSQQLGYCYSSNSRLLSVSSLFHIHDTYTQQHQQQQQQDESSDANAAEKQHVLPDFKQTLASDDMKPFYLALTSVSGRLKERLNTAMSTSLNWNIVKSEKHLTEEFVEQARDNKIIYLTADSETVLDDLVEGHVYVLGGIVDRNRHKNLCKKEAEKHNLRTARLPIDQYMQLASSQVLTVNQCFDIMLKYSETKSWKEAVETVIPKRKVKSECSEQEEGKTVKEEHENTKAKF